MADETKEAAFQWQDRIVSFGRKPADQFQANPDNWRTHGPSMRETMKAALDEVGWVGVVMENEVTGYLVDGHERVWEALQNGNQMVPYITVRLSPEEEAYVLATFDPIGEMAKVDRAKLETIRQGMMATQSAKMQALLDRVANKAGIETHENAEEDDALSVDAGQMLAEKWGTERGQIWEITSMTSPGRYHRFMCGDSCVKADVDALLDGAAPAIMVTDPPYGVNYEPEWRQEAAEEGALAYAARRVGLVMNDDRADWTEAWKLFSGDVVYCWHAALKGDEVKANLEEAGFICRSQIIWAKNRFPVSRGHYHWKHEPCWYAVRKNATSHWVGDRRQTTVWDDITLDKNVDGGHSTQKPVEAMARPIRNHEGDAYDPFVGSGTTIIAAERCERICYAMEISPIYAAAVLERAAAAGMKPKLVGSIING